MTRIFAAALLAVAVTATASALARDGGADGVLAAAADGGARAGAGAGAREPPINCGAEAVPNSPDARERLRQQMAYARTCIPANLYPTPLEAAPVAPRAPAEQPQPHDDARSMSGESDFFAHTERPLVLAAVANVEKSNQSPHAGSRVGAVLWRSSGALHRGYNTRRTLVVTAKLDINERPAAPILPARMNNLMAQARLEHANDAVFELAVHPGCTEDLELRGIVAQLHPENAMRRYIISLSGETPEQGCLHQSELLRGFRKHGFGKAMEFRPQDANMMIAADERSRMRARHDSWVRQRSAADPQGPFYEALKKDFMGGFAYADADKVGVVVPARGNLAEVQLNVLLEQSRVPLFLEWYEVNAEGAHARQGRRQLPRNGQQYKTTSVKRLLRADVKAVGVLDKQGEPCDVFMQANPLLKRKVKPSGNNRPCGDAVPAENCICIAIAKDANNGVLAKRTDRGLGRVTEPAQQLDVMRVNLGTPAGQQFALAVRGLVALPPPFHAFIHNFFDKTDQYLEQVVTATPHLPEPWLRQWADSRRPAVRYAALAPPAPVGPRNEAFHAHFERLVAKAQKAVCALPEGEETSDAITGDIIEPQQADRFVFVVKVTEPPVPPRYVYYLAYADANRQPLVVGLREWLEVRAPVPTEPTSRKRLAVNDIDICILRAHAAAA